MNPCGSFRGRGGKTCRVAWKVLAEKSARSVLRPGAWVMGKPYSEAATLWSAESGIIAPPIQAASPAAVWVTRSMVPRV